MSLIDHLTWLILSRPSPSISTGLCVQGKQSKALEYSLMNKDLVQGGQRPEGKTGDLKTVVLLATFSKAASNRVSSQAK